MKGIVGGGSPGFQALAAPADAVAGTGAGELPIAGEASAGLAGGFDAVRLGIEDDQAEVELGGLLLDLVALRWKVFRAAASRSVMSDSSAASHSMERCCGDQPAIDARAAWAAVEPLWDWLRICQALAMTDWGRAWRGV